MSNRISTTQHLEVAGFLVIFAENVKVFQTFSNSRFFNDFRFFGNPNFTTNLLLNTLNKLNDNICNQLEAHALKIFLCDVTVAVIIEIFERLSDGGPCLLALHLQVPQNFVAFHQCCRHFPG